MHRIIVAVIISLLAGFAVGAWVGGDTIVPQVDAPTGTEVLGADASNEDRLARIEQIIVQEREARIDLEDTLASLFEDVERLEGDGERSAAALEAARQEREERRAAETRRVEGTEADWLTRYQERRQARLVEGGFSEEEARRALQLESEVRYEAMEAAWQAQRNGEELGYMSPEGDPQSILRARLGDEAFERYLEAQGQPTSIGITQVLSGSPGGEAGMRAGDKLVSYGGERVYTVTELRRQTMQGTPGENVIIEVERDGMLMQLSVPRGPIGITGSGARIRGLNWWGG